jgi:hypothetical protein
MLERISKKNSLRIHLAVECLNKQEEPEMNQSKKELSKIMDDIWQRYPNAEVAISNKSKNQTGIIFEI